MKKRPANRTKQILLLLVFYFISQYNVFGQNPAHPDSLFGMAGLSGGVYSMGLQSNGKVIVGGYFDYFKNTVANNITRLNSDGLLDKTFTTGLGANERTMAVAIQPDGKMIIGGWFTTYDGVNRNRIARLNADGTLDVTFNIGTGANSSIEAVLIQPDGKILIGGTFLNFNGTSIKKIARLNTDGTLDPTFTPVTGADNAVKTIALQSDGKILIGGTFLNYDGVNRTRIARLNTDGTLDTGFNPGAVASNQVNSLFVQPDGKILVGTIGIICLNSDGSQDGSFSLGGTFVGDVRTITNQSDGKIIIGGGFTSFNGLPIGNVARLNNTGTFDASFSLSRETISISATIVRSDDKIIIGGIFMTLDGILKNHIALVNSDGSADHSFMPDLRGTDSTILCTSVLSNGKVAIGGTFSKCNNVARNKVAVLNTDGSLDLSFNPGTGVNGNLLSMATQPDGKILIGGSFIGYNGTNINGIARLNPNGSIDPSFNPGSGTNGEVRSIQIQPDGKIIIGGSFTVFNATSKLCLVRLNSDGSLDPTFNIGSGANGIIYSTMLDVDGKILIGGEFTSYNGTTINRIARLNNDGTIDASFNSGGSGANNRIYAFAFQPDKKIIASGDFTMVNGVVKNSIVRLNPNGTIDRTFNIGSGSGGSASISRIALQSDGKIIIAGNFSTYNGFASSKIARLNPDGSRDASFNVGSGISGQNMHSINILTNGEIIVAGTIYFYNGMQYNNIMRLKGDPTYYNTIHGNIYTDNNNDCIRQLSEEKIQSVVIKALPGPYFGGSDGEGKYQVRVDSGTVIYTLTQEYNSINSILLENQCATSHTVSLTGASNDISSYDFADTIKQCSILNISIQNTRMRRCFRNNTYVDYCNYGNAQASNSQIKIEYPDYVVPISSVPMWTSRSGSSLIYDVGVIEVNSCGRIVLTDSVVCGMESIRGLTQCIKASISPLSDCIEENPAWDKSSMKVTGSCSNQNAQFIIQNAGSGDMMSNHDYRIYVNDTLIYNSTFKLQAGEQFIVNYPAQGQTIRLEADQHPLHPGRSRPRATVEGCGISTSGSVRNGLVTTTAKDDLDVETAVTCNNILDSYDPNEKLVLPSGIGSTNQVAPGTELEYIIHFQNTGSDTAFTVRVVDTLDINLDEASFIKGVGSHPYTLQITGKGKAVFSFNFYNINLPDSTTNKSGSNGLVSYRITIPNSISLGTVVRNKAYIFFDYNSAILTNETIHTIGTTTPQDLTRGSNVQVGSVTSVAYDRNNIITVSVFPIPAIEEINFKITGLIAKKYKLTCINALGRTMGSYEFNTEEFKINTEGYLKGIYFYTLKDINGNSTNGKFIVE